MERYPLISCLCPTKNRRRFLAESLRRFMAQDYPGGAELILIEDGEQHCEDLSWQAMIGPHHPERLGSEIRYTRCDGSIGEKLNYGARLARGAVLARWDDDDWYAPERLRIQCEHLQMAQRAVVGLSSVLYWAEGDERGSEYTGNAFYASGATLLYTRAWFLDHPWADASLAEDAAFVAEAHGCGELSTVSNVDIMVVRNHAGNTSPRGVFQIGDLVACGSDNWREVPLSRVQAVIGR